MITITATKDDETWKLNNEVDNRAENMIPETEKKRELVSNFICLGFRLKQ